MKKRLCVTIKFTLFTACLLIFSASLASRVSFSEDNGIVAEPYLHEGDMRMFDGELGSAQKIYEFVLKEAPHSYETLWRLSRLYISHGMVVKKLSDKKKKWREAEDYGRRAVEINPDGAEGHLYLAAAIGQRALFSLPDDKVRCVWEIRKEAEKSIELDPNQEKAYLTLGVWHRNVATASSFEKQFAKTFFGELPEGSLKKSLELLLKSISLGGDNVRNYYELALTYEAMGDYKAAKKEYENALNASLVYPEDTEIKARIKKVLRKSRYY